MKASRNAYFNNKSGGAPKKRTNTNKRSADKKKLKLQVAALQKQVDETSQLSEIAAALRENGNTTLVANTTTVEKSISMARKVMKIIGREKKASSS